MPSYKTLAKLDNDSFLDAVADVAPHWEKYASEGTRLTFDAKGFDALQSIRTPSGLDPVSDFFGCALLVGLQQVVVEDYNDPLKEMGLLPEIQMDLGAYFQQTRAHRIKNTTPLFKGLTDGSSPDPFKVRKATFDQDYWGLNFNYQNWFSWQDFDLKGAWLRANGIGETLSAVLNMIALDKTETVNGIYWYILGEAIHSTKYPLQNTQQIELSADLSTEAGVRAFIKQVKNVARSMNNKPSNPMFNAKGYPLGRRTADDIIILVREGTLSQIEDTIGYAFNPEKLNLPYKIYEVPYLGRMNMVDANGGSLQPVYDVNGSMVGGIDAAATVNGYATKDATTGRYIVNITSAGVTADTFIVEFSDVEFVADTDDAGIVAEFIDKKIIFYLRQNAATAEAIRNPAGMYTNTWFNEPNNGYGYDPYQVLVTFSLPSN